MALSRIIAGTVHNTVPIDVQKLLKTDESALKVWGDITPLARNEWLCWIESAKLIETRERRVQRTVNELAEGIRRPCCWPGCIHRERNSR